MMHVFERLHATCCFKRFSSVSHYVTIKTYRDNQRGLHIKIVMYVNDHVGRL